MRAKPHSIYTYIHIPCACLSISIILFFNLYYLRYDFLINNILFSIYPLQNQSIIKKCITIGFLDAKICIIPNPSKNVWFRARETNNILSVSLQECLNKKRGIYLETHERSWDRMISESPMKAHGEKKKNGIEISEKRAFWRKIFIWVCCLGKTNQFLVKI